MRRRFDFPLFIPFPFHFLNIYLAITTPFFFFYSLTLTLPLAHFKIDPFTFSPDLSFLLFFFYYLFFFSRFLLPFKFKIRIRFGRFSFQRDKNYILPRKL